MLGVSAGLVTLNNTNAIATATLSGGTTTLAGPAVTTANVSGNAVVNVNAGSVSARSGASGGNTTIQSSISVGSASVSGGTVNLIGGVTAGTIDVSAGAGLLNATTPVSITSTLKLPNSVTATLTGAPSFTVGGANLANAATLNNFTFSGGTVSLTVPVTGKAINVVTAAHAYTGVGPSPDTGTYWNNPGLNGSSGTYGLLANSSGGTTSVSYNAAGAGGTSNASGNSNLLLAWYSASDPGGQTFTFGGLSAGVQYNLYAIMNTNLNANVAARATTFTVDGISQTVTTQTNYATTTITSTGVYTELVGLTPSAGSLTISALAPGAGSGGGGNRYDGTYETDVNGFQLIPVSQVSLNSNIAVNATTTLNLGTANAGVTLGTLTLSTTANPTFTLAGAGNFRFTGGGAAISATGTSGTAAINGSSAIQIASGNVNVDTGASLSIGATIQDGAAPRRSTRSAAAT